MSAVVPLGPVSRLLQLGVDALSGKVPTAGEVARTIIGIGLDLVEEEELRAYLTDEARARAELVVDVAQRAKVGPIGP